MILNGKNGSTHQKLVYASCVFEGACRKKRIEGQKIGR